MHCVTQEMQTDRYTFLFNTWKK